MHSLPEYADHFRMRRAFVVEEVLAQKIEKISAYCRDSTIDALVVGVSGGIDSAVVLGILEMVKKQENSPIRDVLALLMPIHTRGATDQDIALARGLLVVQSLNSRYDIWDLTNAQQAYTTLATPADTSTAWAEGQLASVVRTPALYYAAALLQAQGYSSLVVGTTNRDEGAYLGFFGKASDGMVDMQPISDLHKSEVYALARYLGIPQEIIDAVPTGNVYDGRVDEEMIGAPYWFIELYLLGKEYEIAVKLEELSTTEREQYLRWSAAIERQHAKNAHKYRVGSPAVHMDVMPRSIPKGW